MIQWLAKTDEIDLLGPFDSQVEAWEAIIESLGKDGIPPDGSLVWPVKKKVEKVQITEEKVDTSYPYEIKRT